MVVRGRGGGLGSHKRRSCSIVVAFNMVQPDPAFHARAVAPSATCTIPMQGRSYAIQGCGAAGGMRTCEQPTTSLQAVTDLEQGVPFVVLVGCLVLLVVHARVAAPAGCGGPRCGGREWYARCLAGCGATASGRHSCPGCRSTRTERFEIPNSHKKKKSCPFLRVPEYFQLPCLHLAFAITGHSMSTSCSF